jgi:hypothetical protein
MPTFLYNTTASTAEIVKNQRSLVFGDFTHIYYKDAVFSPDALEFTENDLEELLPDFYFAAFGAFYTVYSEDLDTSTRLNLGYADSVAIKLACISIISGKFPVSDNEIALSLSVMEALGCKNLGDNVTINGNTYVLCGYFSDVGHLWTKGDKQLKDNIVPVNAFITKEKAKSLYSDEYDVVQQILITVDIGSDEIIFPSYKDDGNIFENSNYNKMAVYSVPDGFRAVMYVVSLLIVFTLLFLIKDRLLYRMRVYSRLGMTVR